MRNDFGNRPYKSRFPYKKGKSAKRKKQGYAAREAESLGMRTGKNLLRTHLSKRVEMKLMAHGANDLIKRLTNRTYEYIWNCKKRFWQSFNAW